MNASECVARGCALQCAILSPTFKVREFQVILVSSVAHLLQSIGWIVAVLVVYVISLSFICFIDCNGHCNNCMLPYVSVITYFLSILYSPFEICLLRSGYLLLESLVTASGVLAFFGSI
jgi:hypothetical protein